MKLYTGKVAALAAALLLPLGAVAAEPAAPADKPVAAQEAKPKKIDKSCESASASRIRKEKGECINSAAPTRSFSKEEIESTGQTDTAEALKRLDPRFH